MTTNTAAAPTHLVFHQLPCPNFFSVECAAPPTVSGISPSMGPEEGGTSVTITGTNFTFSSIVSFNGSPAISVSLVNATTLTAVTPMNMPGPVDVTETTAGGRGPRYTGHRSAEPA